MKSPFTGGEATLHKELRTLNFRKEEFEVLYHFYVCNDSGEQFTDDEADGINMNQVHNQYRTKYGIPFADEIIAIREKYGLSASKMAEVLGFGTNVYRAYESGEVPSISNGKFLQQIKDADIFKSVVESSNQFDQEEIEKLERKINAVNDDWIEFDRQFEDYLLGNRTPNEFTGYRVPHLQKIAHMILFFAEICKPLKTKLNKLLFYADFYHFKKTCFSISGARYKAIQMGPVPKNFGGIFDYAVNHQFIDITLVDFDSGNVGEKFVANGKIEFDRTLFAESELQALEFVATMFQKVTTREIIEKSHAESAWLENVKGYQEINYKYGFDLKNA